MVVLAPRPWVTAGWPLTPSPRTPLEVKRPQGRISMTISLPKTGKTAIERHGHGGTPPDNVMEIDVLVDTAALPPTVAQLGVLLKEERYEAVFGTFDQLHASGALTRQAVAHADRDAAYILAARACERLGAHDDVLDVFRRYHAPAAAAAISSDDSSADAAPQPADAPVTTETGAAARRNPALACIVFRTLYRAKRYADALELARPALEAVPFRNAALVNMAINCHCKNLRWDDALATFRAMSASYGIRPDAMSYGCAVNACAKSGRWREALRLLDEMSADAGIAAAERNPAALTAAFNAALDACEKNGKWRPAMDLWRRSPALGVRPDAISFGTAINALARGGQCAAAADLYDAMIAAKLEPGLVPSNYLLTHCAKHGAGAAAARVLASMRGARVRATAMSYHAAMTALYRENSYTNLLEVHKEMRLRGLVPDRIATSQAFHACAALHRWDAAAAVLCESVRVGVTLDPEQTSRAFGALAKAGQTAAIRALLADMEAHGLPPLEGCYTALVTAVCKEEGQPHNALAELRRLEARGMPVKVAAYTSVITFCKRPKEWRLALDLFEELEMAPPESGRNPNQMTYNALLGVLTYCGRMDLAAHALARMGAAGHAFDEYTLTSMLLGFAREARWADVLDLFRGLEALEGRRPPVARARNLRWACANEALRGCAALGEWEMALRLIRALRDAAEDGARPDVVMYGAAIGACAKAGRWREALEIIREMEGSDTPPNVVCYSSAITALEKGGEWRKALHLLLRMINAGLRPDIIAYNAAISASAMCGEWHMALKLFDSLLKAGLQPDTVTYGKAMVACFRGGRVGKAMELFVSLQRANVRPSKQTVSVLIELLHQAKEFDRATYVYENAVAGARGGELGDPSLAIVDLHGYSATVARAAIRLGLKRLLQRYINSGMDPSVVTGFTIITGVGAHSAEPYEPVLRPALQSMLLEEVEPPLPTEFVPGNEGRLVVRREHLQEWCAHQTSLAAASSGRGGRAPADSTGSLKLRSPEQLRTEYERAVGAAAAAAAAAALSEAEAAAVEDAAAVAAAAALLAGETAFAVEGGIWGPQL